MPRTYEEVIQRMGESMYHRYMTGGGLYEGLDWLSNVLAGK
jgi:hypothetical protein